MRSGVRIRPSRSGSSPRRSSSSRSSSCVLAADAGDDSRIFFTAAPDFTQFLLIADFPAPGVFKGIEHSFLNTDFLHLSVVKVSFQNIEDFNAQVFGGRDSSLKFF